MELPSGVQACRKLKRHQIFILIKLCTSFVVNFCASCLTCSPRTDRKRRAAKCIAPKVAPHASAATAVKLSLSLMLNWRPRNPQRGRESNGDVSYVIVLAGVADWGPRIIQWRHTRRDQRPGKTRVAEWSAGVVSPSRTALSGSARGMALRRGWPAAES